ncbi:MAG: RseA family anti-sigma factor [Pseudomonadota bacterium]
MNNTTASPTTNSERLSALADGELHHDELLLLLDACKTDDAAADDWNAYHLIGEVLRSPATAASKTSPDFVQRVNQRISMEHALPVLAPVVEVPKVVRIGKAANDSTFRWKLVAGFASLTAVAAITWSSSGLVSSPSGAQLAQAPAATSPVLVVASPQGPMVRDARLEEMLAAHRQLSGASALQAPSGFLNAAFESPQNAGR